jgi:DNA-binding transcriptional MerR regulator
VAAVEGLLRIGDFGMVCRLSIRTLRHYHELGLLEPAHVDPATGYRWYRPDQADRATAIRLLRELDLPLPDVAAVLDAADAERRRSVLDRHRARLQSQVDDAGRRLTAIAELLEERTMQLTVDLTYVEPVIVVSRRISGPTGLEQAMTALGLRELMEPLRAVGIQPTGVPIILVHGGDEETFEQEVCLPVPEGTAGAWTLEGTEAGVAQRTGPPNEGNAAMHEVVGAVMEAHGSFRMPLRVRMLALPPIWGEGTQPRTELIVPFG